MSTLQCIALVVLMALAAANAQVIVSSAYPSFAFRSLAAPLSYPYAYSYYGARFASPIAYTAPAVIPQVVVAPPAVEFGIPKA